MSRALRTLRGRHSRQPASRLPRGASLLAPLALLLAALAFAMPAAAQTDTTKPTFSSATVDGTSLVITFNEAMNDAVTARPVSSVFRVTATPSGGSPRDIDGSGSTAVTVDGAAVTVTLASAVAPGETVTVAYRGIALSAAKKVQDVAGNELADFSGETVTNNSMAPTFSSAFVNGTSLVITFNEAMNTAAGARPVSSVFRVTATPSGGSPRDIDGSGSTAVTVDGAAVTVTLASAVAPGETVTAAYRGIALNANKKVQDVVGNELADFSGETAVNITGDTTVPTLSSAAVNGATLTLNYSEALDTGSVPAAGVFSVSVAGTSRTVSGVAVSGKTVTLTLGTAASAGQTATVSYTKGTNPIQDLAGNDAADLSTQSVTNVTGDTTKPTFSSAAVNGTTLEITFSEDLDTTSKPDGDYFDTLVTPQGGSGRFILALSGQVSIAGKVVTVTLTQAVAQGESVTVSYLKPGINPLRDLAGNTVDTFPGKTVTNNTPAAPTLDNAVVNGTSLRLNYNKTLDTGSTPATSAFTVSVAGTDQTPTGVAVAGSTVTLTLGTAATAGQTVTVSYTVPATNPIQDQAGNDAAALSNQTVTNVTGDTALPTLDSATVNRTTLWLNYTEALDTTSVPAVGSFTVSVDSGTGVNPTAVSVAVNAVTLTLATAVTSTQTVTVSYTKPATNPIEDWAGNDAGALTNQAVTNQTPAVPSPTASATATPSATVTPGATVTLNGSASKAPPGATLTYAWSRTAGPAVTLNNANTARASFTAPDSAVGTTLTFRLTVTATGGPSDGLTATDDVTLTVGDAPPRFVGGVPAMRLNPGEEMTPVTLPAATGGNGGPYSYALASAPADLAGLTFDAGTRRLSGTPEVEGSWAFTYTAHDGDGNTAASDAARLSFRVRVSTFSPERRRVVKRSLAAVAARTAASALGNIGARLGNAVPTSGLTLAGEAVSFGAAAAGLDGACPAGGSGRIGFGQGGFGRIGFGQSGAGCAPGARSRGVTAEDLLYRSSFSLTLGGSASPPGKSGAARRQNAREGTHRGPGALREARWSVWGRGDFGAFSGRPEPGMRYEGDTRTGWLGIDARAGRWVAGLAASHGTSESDYSFDGGDDPSERGRLETKLSALYPYGRWSFANGLELRGLLGGGTGRLRHLPGGDAPPEETDLKMWMASAGFGQKLPPLAGIDLSARGDVSLTRIETEDGTAEIDGLTADSRRVRAGLEASRRFEDGGGRSYTPFLEVAARNDAGDGVTGTGLEVAGGLRHSSPGIEVDLRARWLAAHSQSGTEERGVSATVRMPAGAGGRGLSLSLTPRWGADANGTGALWREEMPDAPDGAAAAEAGAVDLSVGYGIGSPDGRFTGTPNAGLGLSDDGARDYRIGWRLTPGARGIPGFEVSLDATRSEPAGAAAPGHGAMLRGTIRW